MTGLLVLGGLILPAILLWGTRGAVSPLRAAGNFSRALALAFGTSSSSAALPVRPSLIQGPVWRRQLVDCALQVARGSGV